MSTAKPAITLVLQGDACTSTLQAYSISFEFNSKCDFYRLFLLELKTNAAVKTDNPRLASRLTISHQFIGFFGTAAKEISQCTIPVASPRHIRTKREKKKHPLPAQRARNNVVPCAARLCGDDMFAAFYHSANLSQSFAKV